MNESSEERVNVVRDLITVLYSIHDCAAGGPLHIVDDGNLGDSSLDFCEERAKDPEWPSYVRTVALAIIAELRLMSEADRERI